MSVAYLGAMALRVGYLASSSGSSAREIHEAAVAGEVDVESVVMITNNSGSGAAEWARAAHIPVVHLSGRTHEDPAELDEAMRVALVKHRTQVVALSGYAKLVGTATLREFPNRILNVHPAPLPEFGGQGMYRLAVHQAVLDSGIHYSAVSIHVIDEVYDRGTVVAATRVPVEPGDTPESLQARVHALEGSCFVEVLRRIETGGLDLDAL